MILECENISKKIYHEILKKRITDIQSYIRTTYLEPILT